MKSNITIQYETPYKKISNERRVIKPVFNFFLNPFILKNEYFRLHVVTTYTPFY